MTTRATLLGTQDNDPFGDMDSEESISPKPRFRPAVIENPITRAGAVYAMRMIQGAKLHARMQPAPQPVAPRWMPWALGLQGAAVALLLGLWLEARHEAPAYEGLSAAGTAPVAADALVMLKPGTSEQALRELLQAQGASVVAGPTETGAWLLRVDARGLAALRAAPIVQLAEPLQPGPAR